MFGNSKGFRNVPIQTFATAASAPQDHDRKDMQRDRGIIYKPDGSGRDTYVNFDDGGFNRMYQPRGQFHPGTLLLPNLEHQRFFERQKKPHIHSKPVQYKPDGSGRDSYVKSTNGGMTVLTQRSREYRQVFRQSLRAYEPIPSAYYLEKRDKKRATRHSMELTRSTLDNIRRAHGSVKAYNPMLEDQDEAVKFVSSKAVPTVKFDKSPQYNMEQYGFAEVQRPDESGAQELPEFEGAAAAYAGPLSATAQAYIGRKQDYQVRSKEAGAAPASSLAADRYAL